MTQTPAPSRFAHVTQWVFDLDNTLYAPQARLFDQVEVKMTDFMMRTLGLDQARANHLRHHYWTLYGTTLAGLMHEHDIEPEQFLVEVHDINLEHLTPDPALRDGIAALPGQKIVFTNGSAPYARRVLAARGLSNLFDGVYGVEDADFHPKPTPQAYQAIFDKAGISPDVAAMFEDDPRNLVVPHARGMQTIHVAPQALLADHITDHTSDLAEFLAQIHLR
ncbi:pyrimidine 5'-nucleotidase [Rhodobacteraceae bacterium]|nr:pyrimidine 5'-nucleotidase [Paracoccaceae bacterium]